MESLKGHTILLVDDEQDILNFLSYNLKKEGYKVFNASNGEDGVKMVQQIQNEKQMMQLSFFTSFSGTSTMYSRLKYSVNLY